MTVMDVPDRLATASAENVTAAGAPGPELADMVARLRRAMRRAARAVDPANPLAVAQLELLSAVADEPGIRPGELARRLRLAPNSVTTLVNGLSTKGLITRTAGGADARAVKLTLTGKGREAVDGWKRTNASIIETALTALEEDHYRVLSTALPALRELTQAVDAIADASPVDGRERGTRTGRRR
jgi:DNA-binding MarR family transcriptional regulator